MEIKPVFEQLANHFNSRELKKTICQIEADLNNEIDQLHEIAINQDFFGKSFSELKKALD